MLCYSCFDDTAGLSLDCVVDIATCPWPFYALVCRVLATFPVWWTCGFGLQGTVLEGGEQPQPSASTKTRARVKS